ncbi:acyl-CoA thioesterase [Treponema succinifaciens]|uniref:acyl-CoA thioesterase n=1 Tax=Treponema succinifaciens TaxID=167 RepID=UPI003F80E3E0
MTYTTNLTVRSYECDSYSHVNNAVYLNYLETARMDYLHQIGFNYKGIVEAGYYLYVTHIDIFYKNSAFLDDNLIIETTPVKLGAVSGTFHQTIKKEDGHICAEADVTWASVKKNAPARLPKEFIVDGLRP